MSNSCPSRPPATKAYVKPLTGIRGVAALVVAFGHCKFDHLWHWLEPFNALGWGNQAVDLFFVLSSFVLMHNYYVDQGPRFQMREYLAARIARIYPLHLVTMLLLGGLAVIALQRGQITGEYKPVHLVQQALLVNAWPLVGMDHSWNYPAWSISIEWFLYLFILPPLVRAGPLKKISSSLWIMATATIIAGTGGFLAENTISITCGWVALGRGVCGFVAGWAVWSLYFRHRHVCLRLSRWSDFWGAIGLAILGLAAFELVSKWWLLGLAPVLIAALSVDSSTLCCCLLSSRPVVWLGEISYSVYMTHAVVAKMVNATLFRAPEIADPWMRGLIGGAYIGAVFFVAVMAHRFIEVPARFYLRKKLEAASAPSLH